MRFGDQWIAVSWILSKDAITVLFDLQDAPPEPFKGDFSEVRVTDLGHHIHIGEARVDDVTTRPTLRGGEVIFTLDDGTKLQYRYDWTTLSSTAAIRRGPYQTGA